MIIYHCFYDLTYLKIITFDFYHHPIWLGFRSLIVTLFIGIVGISLHLATVPRVNYLAVGQRLIILLTCAALVSMVSYAFFKQRFIFFGTLHFIALASVFGLLFRHGFWFNLVTGSILVGVGINVQHPLFNLPILQWIGLMTYQPATEDYVPLLPWFGIVLLGMFLGKALHHQGYLYRPVRSSGIKRLAWMGRHSLWIYMLHQPLLLGGLLLLTAPLNIH